MNFENSFERIELTKILIPMNNKLNNIRYFWKEMKRLFEFQRDEEMIDFLKDLIQKGEK